jgi:hypothetical protein
MIGVGALSKDELDAWAKLERNNTNMPVDLNAVAFETEKTLEFREKTILSLRKKFNNSGDTAEKARLEATLHRVEGSQILEEQDIPSLAAALKISYHVYYKYGGIEVIGASRRIVCVARQDKADGAGVMKEHFDALQMPRTGASTAGEITHGFTVSGHGMGMLMLRGLKYCENRSFVMSHGWYAVHIGNLGQANVYIYIYVYVFVLGSLWAPRGPPISHPRH